VTTRREAMEKVRKLFALADRAGTPGEAAAAASRAQVILDQWEMTRDEAEAGDADAMISTFDYENGWLDSEGKLTLWKYHLVAGLAAFNGCAAFVGSRGRGRSYEISGRRASVEITRMLFGWIAREVIRISKSQAAGGGLRRAESFRFGMVEMILFRMREDRRLQFEREKAAAHGPAALVRVSDAMERIQSSDAAMSWMKAHRDVRDSGGAEFAEPDPEARAAGRGAGMRLDLGPRAPRLEPHE